MRLVAGGDSFVWGSELPDHKHGGKGGHSNLTFAALLANGDYYCAAYPGIGNAEIAKRVIDAIEPDCMVLVSWTWSTRDGTLHSDDIIIALQEHLVSRNIRYMFTCADNQIVTLNPKIDYAKWFLFPPGLGADKTESPRGFYQWAIEEDYEIAPQHHPLERAHRDAAGMMSHRFLTLMHERP